MSPADQKIADAVSLLGQSFGRLLRRYPFYSGITLYPEAEDSDKAALCAMAFAAKSLGLVRIRTIEPGVWLCEPVDDTATKPAGSET